MSARRGVGEADVVGGEHRSNRAGFGDRGCGKVDDHGAGLGCLANLFAYRLHLLAAGERKEDDVGLRCDVLNRGGGDPAQLDHRRHRIGVHVEHMHGRGMLADRISAHPAAHDAKADEAEYRFAHIHPLQTSLLFRGGQTWSCAAGPGRSGQAEGACQTLNPSSEEEGAIP
ncbi:MAG: hypothetical protein R3D89_06950 [Sphingomonadaceae bacterium]